jgi:hypothetical protein
MYSLIVQSGLSGATGERYSTPDSGMTVRCADCHGRPDHPDPASRTGGWVSRRLFSNPLRARASGR